MLEHSVPPASLSKVSIFAAHLQRYQNKAWLLIYIYIIYVYHLRQFCKACLFFGQQVEEETRNKAAELPGFKHWFTRITQNIFMC